MGSWQPFTKAAVQLNDTHPSLAVTELMRILVDLHNFRWDEAWKITVATLSYNHHTLLPEALETWPVELFERLLPRNLEIIYTASTPRIGAGGRALPRRHRLPRPRYPLIDERLRAEGWDGATAFVGSHRPSTASRDAFRPDEGRTVFHDLNHLYPSRITNKTNGITPALADAGQPETDRPGAWRPAASRAR